MAAATGRWEIRSILSPPGVDLPPVVELSPLESEAPFGACVLGVERDSLVLRDAVYSIPGAPPGWGLYRVTFGGPCVEEGILVACARVHRRVPPTSADGGPADPFGLSRRRRLEETRELVHERVSALRWLDSDAMARRYPREEDAEAAPEARATGGTEDERGTP
jgi:hypothetical protein